MTSSDPIHAQTTFEQLKFIQAQQVNQTPNNTNPQAGDGDWLVVIIVPLSFMVVCATVSSVVFALCRARPKVNKVNLNCQQVPCSNCRFFDNNHYLKCALHPSIVSTKQALNCPDYCH